MPIAIIGISCRFPGDATSPEKLWEMVAEKRSAWSEIPSNRFNQESFYHPVGGHLSTMNVKGGHFMSEDIALFDASFFNFTAELASSMDPQYRLQLESAFEALENAGVSIEKLAKSNTSVFTATFQRDYHDSLMRDPETLPRSFLTGNGMAMMSARLSHFFDLRGSSVTVDTGCSGGLTALHLACQSIRTGEASMALVGGASIMLNPDMFIILSSLGMVSEDGISHSFDAEPGGYGRGEGIATLLLKPLEDAVRDGDLVRAVIRETALNQDGKTPTITSPSQEAQEELIRACYNRSGLDPRDTTYAEAHGTGTKTGDPIEAGAIGAVLGRSRPANKPLYIGSIKSNLGHLEAASGLASIIKMVLAFEKGCLPPSIHFHSPNPKIQFDKLNLKVVTELIPWPEDSLKRVSINNFGYGGSNAHVILEAAEQQNPTQKITNGITNGICSESKQSMVFILSAKDKNSLKTMASDLSGFLEAKTPYKNKIRMEDLAYTLGQRRSRFAWRLAASAKSLPGLIKAFREDGTTPQHSSGAPRLGFVFNGQGAQWHAMGRELIAVYPVFKQCMLEAEQHLKDFGAKWSLIAEELSRDAKSTRVNEAQYSLPMSCSVQLALVRLLASWGIKATAVTGHSSGEVSGAFAAGALNLRQALAIVYHRGVLNNVLIHTSKLRGAMMAVGLGPDDLHKYTLSGPAGKVVNACTNSPTSVTLSGDLEAIELLEEALIADKVFARRLKVETAYHSHHMEPLAKDYLSALDKDVVELGDFNGVLYYSPVTGEFVKTAQELGPEHWVSNMVKPVLFLDSFRNMCIESPTSESLEPQTNIDVVVEIGPHGALAGPIRQILTDPKLKGFGITYASCLTRNEDAVHTMQSLASLLLSKGYPVDIAAVNFPRPTSGLKVLDLPKYPWNHSSRFWMEPRVNKAWRQRKRPGHDLLGSLVPGSTSLAPTWKHVIRIDEIPWVRDHMVGSDIIYPGAGFIVMAIEAMRELHLQEQRTVDGYYLRSVEIMKALVIPDTLEGVEVQLSFQPSDSRELDPSWREFHIYSMTPDNECIEHSSGSISTKYNHADNLAGLSRRQMKSTIDFDPDTSTRTTKVDTKDFFQSFAALGIKHGPSFQNLTAINVGQGESEVAFEIADTASLMPGGTQHAHVLHPITLDAIFQASYSPLPVADLQRMGAAIPRSIKSMFISSNIGAEAHHQFQTFQSLNDHSSQGFNVSMKLFSKEDTSHTPVLEIDELHCRSVGKVVSQEIDSKNKNDSVVIQWEPSIEFSDHLGLQNLLRMSADSSEAILIANLKRATFHLINDALDRLTLDESDGLVGHQKLFFNWMKLQKTKAEMNELAPDSCSWLKTSEGVKQMLYGNVSLASVNGEMLVRIGENLSEILTNEVAPLELMLEDKLLYSYYEKAVHYDRSLEQVHKLVKLFGHYNPKGKILEIGGGTGSCTGKVLDALSDSRPGYDPRFAHYDFTDISSGFFEVAREKFDRWRDQMGFKRLDIEQDPSKQSFELGSYDLIIACQVLHATKAMNTTMTHVRQLLKPGGKLIMMETTQEAIDAQLVFGTLPGWWLSEEKERKHSPNLTVPHWDKVLKRCGFSGLDVEARDCEDDDNYAMSVIMSTAKRDDSPRFPEQIVLVYTDALPPQPWLEQLKVLLAKLTSTNVTVERLDRLNPSGKVCIFLSEMEHTFLSKMDETRFEKIKALLTRSQGVFWITRGAALECKNPSVALQTGLLRTLRLEDTGRQYITLDIDSESEPWTASTTSAIWDVFRLTFDLSIGKPVVDCEYALRGSGILVPRMYSDVAENYSIPAAELMDTKLEPFYQSNREIRLDVAVPGLLDSLAFIDVGSTDETLPDDFVEIRPEAFGLNFRDLMVSMGQLKEKVMGFECSGRITRLGPNPSHGLQINDRICALTHNGHYSNFVRVHSTGVARIPDDMTFEVAASIPMIFITAYHALVDTARLESGETVLIHAAAGGVGQAAIMIAKWIGAKIFVTVGSNEKRDFLTKTYGIPPNHMFSSRDNSFAAGIMAATDFKGVDVLLNSLSGELLQEGWNIMAYHGRLVEIGKRDIQLNKNLEMLPFHRAISFSAIDLIHLGNYKNRVVSRVLASVLELFSNHDIQPVQPISVLPISEIQRGFRILQAGKQFGKIVIKPQLGDLVQVLPTRKVLRLSPDASYLIVGGMGGLGRSIAQWLVRHGAKTLIMVSRSAASQNDAELHLNRLKAQGCRVILKNCNIANEGDLSGVLSECALKFPPIKGVIQAAMVLQDSVFEHMNFQQWQKAVHPKVAGTYNLHRQLGVELDFFVMLSSSAGVVGNTSQANYAAGGTFEDAFARYRASQGLPAVSLDLGMVQSVGYVSETKGVAERLAKLGWRPLGEQEVFHILETAMLHPRRDPRSSQIITGLEALENDDDIVWRREPRFWTPKHQNNQRHNSTAGHRSNDAITLQDGLSNADSSETAVALVTAAVISKLSAMFMLPDDEIKDSAPLSHYGVDSLVAVELRNWLNTHADCDISIFDVLQSVSLKALAGKVVERSKHVVNVKS
ncbi:Highly reducing polyketide synthase [Lachnellula subtilissima]|uniref:Highly reducing polyketide synthase n=1 Tax=Lachnellula subtilissima TaxID=602034 RepID=A0A8H8U5U3_9HELO|nr:Highly reducing polyketide synthase [Lachnellula subtilissima]